MAGWRNARLLGIHCVTWCAVVFIATIGLLAQIDDVRLDDFAIGFQGWPMALYYSSPVTFWLGLVFNAIFYAVLVRAVAYVSEQLIRDWRKLSQLSLAALVWISSATAGTLAMFSQDYLPIVYKIFEVLHIVPARDLVWYFSLPTYFGIGCALYWVADSTIRFCTTAIRRSQRVLIK